MKTASPHVPREPFRESFDRRIDYLRISITDKCNLKCIYCMPEKGLKHFAQADILTSDEIVRVVRIACKYGVRKARLTGGEPLLRVDIIPLITGKDVHVRFIEFMPIGNRETWKPDAYLSKDEIMERVAAAVNLIRLPFKGGGPSRNYRLEGAPGMIGFISAISDCFCGYCNRLRLTAIGKIRPCLFSEASVDVKTPLRSGASDEELETLYRHAVLSKPARHALRDGSSGHPTLSPMSQIGG